jgi:hypothetical protein
MIGITEYHFKAKVQLIITGRNTDTIIVDENISEIITENVMSIEKLVITNANCVMKVGAILSEIGSPLMDAYGMNARMQLNQLELLGKSAKNLRSIANHTKTYVNRLVLNCNYIGAETMIYTRELIHNCSVDLKLIGKIGAEQAKVILEDIKQLYEEDGFSNDPGSTYTRYKASIEEVFKDNIEDE